MEIMTAIGAMPTLDLVALAAVALIGLPHGALDGAIAMHLGLARRPLVFVRFLLLYIGMAGLVATGLLALYLLGAQGRPRRAEGD